MYRFSFRRASDRRIAAPLGSVLRRALELACIASLAGAASPAAVRAIHIDEAYGYLLGPCSGTEDKPQSKLWWHDGRWWGIIDSPDGNRIFELDRRTWKPQPGADGILGGHDGRADVLWDGRRLVVLLYNATLPQLFEFRYDAGRHVYRRERDFPVPLQIAPGSTETMVIDEDSHRRLWGAYVVDTTVYVAHSEPDHRRWELPGQVLQDSLHKDDICSVIAFGHGHVGVFWSDQNRDEFGFRTRSDGDPVDVWGPKEIADHGPGHADDHVHLAADSRGRVYAVTKDDSHHLQAHMRAVDGTWKTQYNVLGGGDGTRPIVMVAESDNRLVMLYVRWHEGTETINYRVSPLGDVAFGEALPFMAVPAQDLNNVSGTKRSLPHGGIVAVADGGKMAWWNGWGPGVESGPPDLVARPSTLCADAALALDFDEGSGHEVFDASPHRARGDLGGPWADDASEPQWTPGVSGSALRFDGVREFVKLHPAPQFDFQGNFTVEAWVRRDSHATKDAILCKSTPSGRGYQLRLKEGRVELVREVVGGTNHIVPARTAIADSLWHHVACVVDIEAGQSRIYVDGTLDAAVADSGASVPREGTLYIGARPSDHGMRDWFHGDIDLVRLTGGVRYSSDFTPPRLFETRGSPVVVLSWLPRYAGGPPGPTYDILRGIGGSRRVKLNSGPLLEPAFVDTLAAPGRLHYEVRVVGRARSGRCDLVVDWPPPPRPPPPADPRGSW